MFGQVTNIVVGLGQERIAHLYTKLSKEGA